jgi:hypothetical protein
VITFTYDPVPGITAVNPPRGPLAGGTAIAVTGTDFVAGSTTVTVGGAACTGINVTGPTDLACVTPAGSAGAASVVATTPGGASGAATFTYDPVPTVGGVSPAGGPLAGGTTITVSGSGFVSGSSTVTVGGLPCGTVVVANAASLTCVTPAGTAGTTTVMVTTPGGGSNAGVFTYDAVPTLASVDPALGPLAGGTTISAYGTDFIAGSTTVTVGGLPCASVTVAAPTVVTCVTPAGAAGAANVVVTTPGGPSNAAAFTYVAGPTLATVTPPDGLSSGGTTITLAGSGFIAGSTTVTVGGAPCGSVTVPDAASVICVTPPGTAGASVNIVATTPGGTSNAIVFTYQAIVDAACGSAANVTTAFMPTANLCSAGTASAVAVGSPWTWTCAGSGGGSSASCSAPNQTTATGSGPARAVISGGTWVVDTANSAGFIPVTGHPKSPPYLPAGYSFPQGLLDFQLINGAAGSAATVTITYPTALPIGTVYWKYGPSPAGFNCSGAGCALPHWYVMPAVIAGNTVTLTIVDGGVGDDDLAANSVIVDQGGPGVPGAGTVVGVPTLSEWAMALLALLLVLSAWLHEQGAAGPAFLRGGSRR